MKSQSLTGRLIFEQVVKGIKDVRPTENNIAGNSLTLDAWLDFRKKFTHYSLDVVLGDNSSITEWEKVVFGLGTGDITLAYLALCSGRAWCPWAEHADAPEPTASYSRLRVVS